MSASVPSAFVACPDCPETIEVPIAVELHDTDEGQQMTCTPDMADLWAHSWTHR